MGKIDELIKELCPDGVEYVKLGEIATLSRGKVYSKEYVTENAGVYPLYSSQTRNDGIFGLISSFDYEGEYLTWTTDGAYAGSIFHRKGKFSITNVCGLITIKNKCISYRFLYYWLSIHAKEYVYEGMGNPKLMTNQMIGIQIPLPPLSIQQQIVEILDNFTDSISNLQEELELREKQMEYYRENLLSFDGEDVEYVSFGQSFHLKARIGWQGLTKQEYRNQGLYKLVTGTDFTDNHRINFSKCVYVDKERFDQDKNIQLKEDDILITKDGTLGKVAYIDKLPCPTTLNGGVFVVRNITGELNQRFTMHFLASSKFKRWIDSNHTSGSIKHLTQKLLVKFQIPVPSLSRQQEIVDILDTFESMIANIKEEIELRQKQYEYYREKLLTFD